MRMHLSVLCLCTVCCSRSIFSQSVTQSVSQTVCQSVCLCRGGACQLDAAQALVKFNEALAHNKQLRETIDNLRRERQALPLVVLSQ